MRIPFGIIADDFTGATDIASFMAGAGWRVIQLNGVPDQAVDITGADALVVSLKSRSCAAEQAVSLSRQAADWLTAQGCQRLYFKYCSTFDSTEKGNIGPVTDMLMQLTGAGQALLCPALPVNGRTVVHGYLFVNGELLSESGMKDHPLTPMTDAFLPRVMMRQARGECGMLPLETLRQGKEAIHQSLRQQQEKRYIVADALNHQDLLTLADALPDDMLLTGGSGLAGAIAAVQSVSRGDSSAPLPEKQGKSLVLSGSCSAMTNRQVAFYRQHAPALAIDVEQAVSDPQTYLAQLIAWYHAQPDGPAPMFYATRPPEEIKAIQQRYGASIAGDAVETLFAQLAVQLSQQGVNKLIIAGGETSSLVAQQLEVAGFIIGETIAPGVPWVKDVQRPLWLALKSGNFGEEDFFTKAQEFYHE